MLKNIQIRYGYQPDKAAVYGFDLTMDTLLKLAYKNNLLEASQWVGTTEYANYGFNFIQKEQQGFYNEAVYVLKYEEDLKLVEIK